MTEKDKFTKSDMDRVGIFQEMGYISIGDKYNSSNDAQFNQSAGKGKQLMSGCSKSKTATQTGYFSDQFMRVMDGEAYSDQVKMRRQFRLKEAQKNIGKPFVPSSGEKKPSGVGSYYGTLSGPIPALSPQMKPGKGYKAAGKNFYTNPGKKGTGYGYVGVTLGRYHEYSSDKYDIYKDLNRKENEAHKKALKGGAFRLNMAPKDFFDDNPYKADRQLPPAKKMEEKKFDFKPFKPSSPAKLDGGMKAGTFDSYPSHSANPYKTRGLHDSFKDKNMKTFFPSAGPKSAPVNSVLHQNVTRSINVQNFRTTRSVMTY